MTCLVMAAMIGVTRTVWAITIAVGVYSKPSGPSGPLAESIRYTASPTTTGGSPMNAFTVTIKVPLPGNRRTASKAPSGNPIRHAMATAKNVTCSERVTISTSEESSE